MMLVSNYLGQSAIHGTGLFAGEDIAKGTKIWEFIPGLDVEMDEALLTHTNPNIARFLQRYSYPHPEQQGRIILDGDNGRFMNHSENPNTDFTQTKVGYARFDIPRGTEFTTNYNEFAPNFYFI
jgi:SET domain-containing protein